MKRSLLTGFACVLMAASAQAQKSSKKDSKQAKSALDQYVDQAHQRAEEASSGSPGSLWQGSSVLGDIAVDLRARNIDDLVTILVSESVNAVSTGTTKTQRASNANASIIGLAGTLAGASPLTDLLNVKSANQLNGQGTTTRQTTLSTTLTARVVDVLPNGYLVIEGNKNVLVNSENQVVRLRGVVRPTDLSTFNTVRSDSIGQLELQVNGKGVVNDSIRRPNFLYRLLLGVLPF